MKVTFCCQWLQNSVEHWPNKGVSVCFKNEFGTPRSVLVFRILDEKILSGLKERLPDLTPYSIGAEAAFRFCPGCGYDLRKWIEQHPDEYAFLSNEFDQSRST